MLPLGKARPSRQRIPRVKRVGPGNVVCFDLRRSDVLLCITSMLVNGDVCSNTDRL
jgi:hypothetical protein